jgi:hypothetical protein
VESRLNRVKSLSRLDAVIDDAFPERHVYISKRAIEFISQAIAEFEEDNMQPDKSFLKQHQHHMGELVSLHSLLALSLTYVFNLAFR